MGDFLETALKKAPQNPPQGQKTPRKAVSTLQGGEWLLFRPVFDYGGNIGGFDHGSLGTSDLIRTTITAWDVG